MENGDAGRVLRGRAKDLWSAQKQILQALPKMIKAATATPLKQTKEHVRHLERSSSHSTSAPEGRSAWAWKGYSKRSTMKRYGQGVDEAGREDKRWGGDY